MTGWRNPMSQIIQPSLDSGHIHRDVLEGIETGKLRDTSIRTDSSEVSQRDIESRKPLCQEILNLWL